MSKLAERKRRGRNKKKTRKGQSKILIISNVITRWWKFKQLNSKQRKKITNYILQKVKLVTE